MPSTGLRVLVLIVAASGAAAFTNAVRPKPLPWVIDAAASLNTSDNQALREKVSLGFDETMQLYHSGATFVDARKVEEYTEGHLSGAINIPSTEKEKYLDTIYTMLPHGTMIVIYCTGGNCEASHEVFEFLANAGFSKNNLRLFEPGWEFFSKQNDVPTTKGPQP